MPTLTLKGTYMKRNILNIVNFLRGTEPRTDTDIHKPFLEQLRLMKENNLRGTFLLQYDALTDPFYTDILKELPPEGALVVGLLVRILVHRRLHIRCAREDGGQAVP